MKTVRLHTAEGLIEAELPDTADVPDTHHLHWVMFEGDLYRARQGTNPAEYDKIPQVFTVVTRA